MLSEQYPSDVDRGSVCRRVPGIRGGVGDEMAVGGRDGGEKDTAVGASLMMLLIQGGRPSGLF